MNYTEEQVEKAAAAMYYADPERRNWTLEDFSDLTQETQNAWRAMARAAFEAVKSETPTHEKEQALLRSLFDNVALDEHFDFDLTNMVNSLDDAHRIFLGLLDRLRDHDRDLRKQMEQQL